MTTATATLTDNDCYLALKARDRWTHWPRGWAWATAMYGGFSRPNLACHPCSTCRVTSALAP